MKIYESGKILREKLLLGISKLEKNVGSTLGPRGRNVILSGKNKQPIITKDGISVCRFMELEDPFENVAVQIAKQAAEKTNSSSGDGTTTTTIIACNIFKHAQPFLAAGISPIDLKRGIDRAIETLTTKLSESSKQVTSQNEIFRIATISANGDETIGHLIADAVDKVGRDGSVLIQEGKSFKTTFDIIDGLRIDGGFGSPQFITNERKGIMTHSDPYFFVTDYRIDTVQQILPVLEIAARENKPLIIIAEEIEGQALAAIVANSLRGTMAVGTLSVPKYGEEKRLLIADLAIALGATLISRTNPKQSLDKVRISDLGHAGSIESSKNHTSIINSKGDPVKIKNRIEDLKEEIIRTDDLYHCARLQERITRLSGGVAIINVGANTEIEMIEKKHRIEDALEAVRSALEEGITPGGGTTLAKLANDTKDIEVDFKTHKYGVEIVLLACQAPLRTIIENSGGKPDLVISMVLDSKKDECYDAVNEKIVNAFDSGIIDPVKVVRVALQNAGSVASTLLTTDHCIVEG